jgi:hypothetical protein
MIAVKTESIVRVKKGFFQRQFVKVEMGLQFRLVFSVLGFFGLPKNPDRIFSSEKIRVFAGRRNEKLLTFHDFS